MRDLDRERRVRIAGDSVRYADETRGPVVLEWAIDPDALEFLLDAIPEHDGVHADLERARELAKEVLWRRIAGRL